MIKNFKNRNYEIYNEQLYHQLQADLVEYGHNR